MAQRKTVKCPECDRDVLEECFQDHQLTHNGFYLEEDNTFYDEVASKEKNIDATKLYAPNYRERGKYGSHPGHDGFDDESNP